MQSLASVQSFHTASATAPSSAERMGRVMKVRGEGLLRETKMGGQWAGGGR